MQDYYSITARDMEVDLVKDFLRISQRALEKDHSYLAAQLQGCIPSLSMQDYPLVCSPLINTNHIERTLKRTIVLYTHDYI